MPAGGHGAILVSVTRTRKAPETKPKPRARGGRIRANRWALQDAKARFSELVRRASSEGPQHVTVHGHEQVVVVAADEYQRLAGSRTGAELVAALQASPHRDVDIEPPRLPLPVRAVDLP